MIGTILITVGFTAGAAISGRVIWINGVRIGQERAREEVKDVVETYASVQKHWYENAHELETIDLRKTEFEAKLDGIEEVAKLI